MNVFISIILFLSPHNFSYEDIYFKIFGKDTKDF